MNEVKMLSDKKYEITVGDETVKLPKSSFKPHTNKYGQEMWEFVYYQAITQDKTYKIAEDEYQTKIVSINEGKKFIKLDDDIVNVNQIKMFKKCTGYKLTEEIIKD